MNIKKIAPKDLAAVTGGQSDFSNLHPSQDSNPTDKQTSSDSDGSDKQQG